MGIGGVGGFYFEELPIEGRARAQLSWRDDERGSRISFIYVQRALITVSKHTFSLCQANQTSTFYDTYIPNSAETVVPMPRLKPPAHHPPTR